MLKVSIVVPVYKVEKYLDRCVKSLCNQTLQDIEIILVDDGSPDRCPVLCDELAKKDSRIKVVHKKNGGLSSARNAGMEIATGEYIGFVDSDDDVELNMYEKMYHTAITEQVDFVMADYVRVEENGNRWLKTLDIRGGFYCKDDIRKEIFPSLIMGENLEYGPLLSVWHCLYRRDFLKVNNLKFDEKVRWSEDNIFSAIMGYCTDSFYYMKGDGLYHYYQNPGTITTSYREGAWKVYCTMNMHLHQFFDKVTDYDFSGQLKLHLIFYACNCLGQVKKSSQGFFKQVALLGEIMEDDTLKKTFEDFKISEQWSLKLKLQIELIRRKLALIYRIMVLR